MLKESLTILNEYLKKLFNNNLLVLVPLKIKFRLVFIQKSPSGKNFTDTISNFFFENFAPSWCYSCSIKVANNKLNDFAFL